MAMDKLGIGNKKACMDGDRKEYPLLIAVQDKLKIPFGLLDIK